MEKEKNIKKDSVNTSQIYTSLSSSSIASGLNVRGTIVEQLKRPPLYVVRLIQVSSLKSTRFQACTLRCNPNSVKCKIL